MPAARGPHLSVRRPRGLRAYGVEELQEIVSGEFDLLVVPLGRSVDARDRFPIDGCA